MTQRSLRVIVLVAATIVAGAASACSTSATQSPGGPSSIPPHSPAAALTAAPSPKHIVAAAQRADAAVESGSFVVDATLTIAGDGARLGIAQVRQLIGRPIAVRLEGSVATRPLAIDGTLTLSLAGESVTLSMKAVGGRAWVEYADSWYRLPPGPTREFLAKVAGSPGLPDLTRQLVGLGLDPAAWDPTYGLVGIETQDGAAVYHVTTAVDAHTALAAIGAALAGPDLWAAVGLRPPESESVRTLVRQVLSVLDPQVTELAGESWIGVDDNRTRKSTVTLAVDFGEQAAAAGLDGRQFALESDASHVGEPVTVVPPVGALPFKRLRKMLESAPDGLLGGL